MASRTTTKPYTITPELQGGQRQRRRVLRVTGPRNGAPPPRRLHDQRPLPRPGSLGRGVFCRACHRGSQCACLSSASPSPQLSPSRAAPRERRATGAPPGLRGRRVLPAQPARPAPPGLWDQPERPDPKGAGARHELQGRQGAGAGFVQRGRDHGERLLLQRQRPAYFRIDRCKLRWRRRGAHHLRQAVAQRFLVFLLSSGDARARRRSTPPASRLARALPSL